MKLVANVPINLLNSFIKTVKKIGVEKTQTILDQSSHFNSQTIDSFIIVQIIQNAVCKEFQISKERLIEEKKKGETRADASRVFVYLLKEILNYKRSDLFNNNIMKIKNQTYFDYIQYIEKLEPEKITCHRDLLIRVERIKKEISQELQSRNLLK